jgi:hypothetical protein
MSADTQAPAPGEYRMHGDPVQPGRKSAAPLESRHAAPCSDERFLGAVFGRLALPGQTQAQTVDSRRELPI